MPKMQVSPKLLLQDLSSEQSWSMLSLVCPGCCTGQLGQSLSGPEVETRVRCLTSRRDSELYRVCDTWDTRRQVMSKSDNTNRPVDVFRELEILWFTNLETGTALGPRG